MTCPECKQERETHDEDSGLCWICEYQRQWSVAYYGCRLYWDTEIAIFEHHNNTRIPKRQINSKGYVK